MSVSLQRKVGRLLDDLSCIDGKIDDSSLSSSSSLFGKWTSRRQNQRLERSKRIVRETRMKNESVFDDTSFAKERKNMSEFPDGADGEQCIGEINGGVNVESDGVAKSCNRTDPNNFENGFDDVMKFLRERSSKSSETKSVLPLSNDRPNFLRARSNSIRLSTRFDDPSNDVSSRVSIFLRHIHDVNDATVYNLLCSIAHESLRCQDDSDPLNVSSSVLRLFESYLLLLDATRYISFDSDRHVYTYHEENGEKYEIARSVTQSLDFIFGSFDADLVAKRMTLSAKWKKNVLYNELNFDEFGNERNNEEVVELLKNRWKKTRNQGTALHGYIESLSRTRGSRIPTTTINNDDDFNNETDVNAFDDQSSSDDDTSIEIEEPIALTAEVAKEPVTKVRVAEDISKVTEVVSKNMLSTSNEIVQSTSTSTMPITSLTTGDTSEPEIVLKIVPGTEDPTTIKKRKTRKRKSTMDRDDDNDNNDDDNDDNDNEKKSVNYFAKGLTNAIPAIFNDKSYEKRRRYGLRLYRRLMDARASSTLHERWRDFVRTTCFYGARHLSSEWISASKDSCRKDEKKRAEEDCRCNRNVELNASFLVDNDRSVMAFNRFNCQRLRDGWLLLASEYTVYDRQASLGGSIDAIYIPYPQFPHLVVLVDWKRCEIDFGTKYYSANPSMRYQSNYTLHYPKANYWKYAMQLNVYRELFERMFAGKMIVLDMMIVSLPPDSLYPFVYSVPRINDAQLFVDELRRVDSID